ncbi:MAG: hypothetical protein U0800_28110 [Isosphaeraceae bacterium]
MPITVGQDRRHEGVALVLRNELVSCPRCRRLVLVDRIRLPGARKLVTRDPTGPERKTLEIGWGLSCRLQGFAANSFGARHTCDPEDLQAIERALSHAP